VYTHTTPTPEGKTLRKSRSWNEDIIKIFCPLEELASKCGQGEGPMRFSEKVVMVGQKHG
jgi:hypothetical protein